jgi:hypothetical protein
LGLRAGAFRAWPARQFQAGIAARALAGMKIRTQKRRMKTPTLENSEIETVFSGSGTRNVGQDERDADEKDADEKDADEADQKDADEADKKDADTKDKKDVRDADETDAGDADERDS